MVGTVLLVITDLPFLQHYNVAKSSSPVLQYLAWMVILVTVPYKVLNEPSIWYGVPGGFVGLAVFHFDGQAGALAGGGNRFMPHFRASLNAGCGSS